MTTLYAMGLARLPISYFNSVNPHLLFPLFVVQQRLRQTDCTNCCMSQGCYFGDVDCPLGVDPSRAGGVPHLHSS